MCIHTCDPSANLRILSLWADNIGYIPFPRFFLGISFVWQFYANKAASCSAEMETNNCFYYCAGYAGYAGLLLLNKASWFCLNWAELKPDSKTSSLYRKKYLFTFHLWEWQADADGFRAVKKYGPYCRGNNWCRRKLIKSFSPLIFIIISIIFPWKL